MNTDQTLNEFIENFNIVDNALDMRYLRRWNGRDFGVEENLSEHTHLVTACVIELYDTLKQIGFMNKYTISFETLVRGAMLHDSLELYSGDILSITKDRIRGLRNEIEIEEDAFMATQVDIPRTERLMIRIADLKACYKFIERVLEKASSDYAHKVYISCKEKYDKAYIEFLKEYGYYVPEEVDVIRTLTKGYADDAGTDIILTKDVTILPMSTEVIDLDVVYTPEEGEMGFLCARTSAAVKGLCVAMCPIDPYYKGTIKAIVHNISNNIIIYKKGESFCQLLSVYFNDLNAPVLIKKTGKRSDSWNGGTDK